jgi:murein DD-endopeptidase MepM/ murein hydrolase activator NlpD
MFPNINFTFLKSFLRFSALANLIAGAHLLGASASMAGNPAEPVVSPKGAGTQSSVKVSSRREGAVTHFYVENNEFCEITMTFEVGLKHLTDNVGFPYTATFPPRQVTEAFVLTPSEPGAKWEYSYTNYFKLGSNCVRHDDSCIYQLPYAPGAKYKVTQGYNSSFSHKGSNLYAIDWKMPEGTLVYAARGGLVVKVRDDSNIGGASMKYDRFCNYVLIRHDDGTLGHYCHLQKNGVVVKAGQTVAAGDVIAHSGNTGFSSGAHLHFSVFKTRNGRERESIPVRFKTDDDWATTLVENHSYRAAAILSAAPRVSSQSAWSWGNRPPPAARLGV